ncbi:16S rRNA (cytosine(967)-C(5))-methyltransferase RsmB [Parasporobacterium paucivorans]|uniref:16S rRNA (cytosine(967)-C(5))-methyltransferase n=1 Tax=Parasporobacterium paucivorans DSM 15970 TaxID=1122934 RepID=A0A1M6ESC4_9FIRM|nr:16S rRNA (cytosine(967)-C(5))-methyltransferase RsmB [Parasporobacterium paucivorans]SHI88259.1 16S rRNA (cytosine967-C5)-methyltransferase [Parasporobacterium paucivorans DSM 15970]
MIKIPDTREIALEMLIEILEKNHFSHLVLRKTLGKHPELDKSSRSFISRLTEGTIENLIKIDYILNLYSKVKVAKMKPLIRNLLRLSVYQILYMDNVPDRAVCNEAVNIAAKRGFVSLKGYMNGVLRTVARNADSIEYPEEEGNPVLALSVKYSMPEWIIELWLEQLGEDKTLEILDGFSVRNPLSVRCNLSLARKEDIVSSLENQNIQVVQNPFLEDALYMEGYDSPGNIEAFQKGYIQIQDISSMLVGYAADIHPGDFVLDLCAAPGGKSIHAADLLKGSGQVVARDVTEYKTGLIQENIARSGFGNIRTEVKDATVFDESSVDMADVLIADLPCSGLGVLAKKTDLRYKIQRDSLKNLAALQRDILKNAARYVKPGKVLIYSTCTINILENQDNVRWFLENHPYTLESLKGLLPETFLEESAEEGWTQLFPGKHGNDGFFIARFRRKMNE